MDPGTLKNPECEFRKIGSEMSNVSTIKLIRLWLTFAFPKLMEYLKISFDNRSTAKYYCNLIKGTIEYRKEKGIYRNDFVQMMIQLKEKGKIEVQTWDANDDYLKTDSTEHAPEKIGNFSCMYSTFQTVR